MTGVVIFVAELLRHLEASVRVFLQETQEVFSLNKIHLARVDSLGGQLVGLSGYCRAEAEDLSRFGNFEDESFPIRSTNGQLNATFAEDENASRRLALNKQHRSLGIGSCVLDGLKCLESGRIQVTEDPIGTHLTGQTTFNDIESVR